ncbi:hemolysin family protein [Mariluticola halotolerans]|uniref:hemolysin family protein n=1 Tax=Mariluticola halotolerans TaxID=2909283 RepID=UPI0026E3C5DE|nr:hemolysin family protein [Mariluticola halotolerans]UJQ93518.1 hemolysin family protein [Mariluticola halotolerans]
MFEPRFVEMNDSDQSTAAATGPHRSNGDSETGRKPSAWTRLRALLTFRSASLRDDLAEALEDKAHDGTGAFSDNERAILQNVLKLGGMRVGDVMVPRANIEAVDEDETMATLIATFHSAGHSRLPVYADNLDNILGFVHIKDALQRLTEIRDINGSESNGKEIPVKMLTAVLKHKIGHRDMVRKVLFVPPSMPVGDLLQTMQATRVHMAMVVDEYGGTDGLVTIEDLLEAVVGDIEDEHDDEDEDLVRKIDDNTYVADARVELNELQEIFGTDFQPGVHAEDADTLGGLIFDLIDRVPVRGEVVTRLKGFEFEIMQADPRRIRKVRIVRRKRLARARPTTPPLPVQQNPAEPSGQADQKAG